MIIEFSKMIAFGDEINALRQNFPELARELDDCLFTVTENHTPKCGHGMCSCQTMTAAEFHRERNIKFKTNEVSGDEFIQ